MALVALDGTPLVVFGGLRGEGAMLVSTNSAAIQDAANEATIYVGQLMWADGASHTVNTTGSSSLGWLAGSSTFADAGTTFVVGLATVDTATGPPARATNVANVITPSVSRSYTSAAPITSAAWNESVPTSGTMTIAHAEFVAFFTQMTARGGADSIITFGGSASSGSSPTMTSYVGGVYTASTSVPNCVVTASDGTLGFFFGGSVFATSLVQRTWNNTSGTKEYGNYFLLPFPTKIYGLIANLSVGGDCDLVLYSDPLGTPVAEKTASIDANTISSVSAGGQRINQKLFTTPYTTTSRQPLAGIMKPSSATNVDAVYLTLNAASHQAAYPMGTNCYAVSRDTGAFAAQNSSKDRYGVGLLVGAFEHGVQPTYALGI